jgi:hypothetical protein
MPLLTAQDFKTGRVKISTDQNTEADFAVYYTDEALKQYLYPILGKELADEYLATPTASKFDPINGFLLIANYESLGMKECLKNFVAAEYAVNQVSSNSANGYERTKTEATQLAPLHHTVIYNRAVTMAKAIQQYCLVHKEDFENFKGLQINFQSL